jgi:hypothetical protein
MCFSLAFGHHDDRTPTHGYEATREAAMAAFAKSWRRGDLRASHLNLSATIGGTRCHLGRCIDGQGTLRAIGTPAGAARPKMMVKVPLPGSSALLEKVQERLGPNRLPLLIAIDGPDGVGKSSLASWLAWQLGAPAVHLDLYLNRDSNPLSWQTGELRRIVSARLDKEQPVVVEGIMMLDALAAVGRKADFLVYLDEGGYTLSERLAAYRARHQPEQRADLRMQGFAE